MVRTQAPNSDEHLPLHQGPDAHILIIESPYYKDVTDELAKGALAVLEANGVGFDRVAVTGALEIPQAFAQAVAAGLFGAPGKTPRYTGVIVLGCVIRGETSHYDIVCNSTNHWLMQIATDLALPVGNAVLTVDTHAQAMARAEGGIAGKGGDAARACLRLIEVGRDLASGSSR
jgi:6,7-dimethyl-8-ribityllumazine synthase